MKTRLTVLWFLLASLVYAGGRIQFTENEARSLFAKSSVVFILHWNEEAKDYFVEHLKGYPRPENFQPPLVSWRRYAAEIPNDPFEPSGNIPPRFILVFMNAAPESELYVTYCYTPKFAFRNEHLEPDKALSILRAEKKSEEKSEPSSKKLP